MRGLTLNCAAFASRFPHLPVWPSTRFQWPPPRSMCDFGSPWPWRVCSRKCCRQSVQRSGRARLVQHLCAGFGCLCASRRRWGTLGIGDRWLSTFSWRSVGLGCHHVVCIAVRWNPTQAMGRCCAQLDSGRNARIPNSPGVSGGNVLAGDGQRKRITFFCSLQRPKFAEFPNH